jgi:hypothetical protein
MYNPCRRRRYEGRYGPDRIIQSGYYLLWGLLLCFVELFSGREDRDSDAIGGKLVMDGRDFIAGARKGGAGSCLIRFPTPFIASCGTHLKYG